MKCRLITTASELKRTELLQTTLKRYNWDYHIITHSWQGFGDKILKTAEYLKANRDITHFFYSDSYDTLAFDTMEVALSRITNFDCILMSGERACYPHPDKAVRYPEHNSPFKYVNGGGWFCNSEVFLKAVKDYPLTQETVDQVWFTDLFLNRPDIVKLDYNCEIFQTIAFCPEDNFGIIEGKVFNTITKTFPIFVHANGKTNYDRFIL